MLKGKKPTGRRIPTRAIIKYYRAGDMARDNMTIGEIVLIETMQMKTSAQVELANNNTKNELRNSKKGFI